MTVAGKVIELRDDSGAIWSAVPVAERARVNDEPGWWYGDEDCWLADDARKDEHEVLYVVKPGAHK